MLPKTNYNPATSKSRSRRVHNFCKGEMGNIPVARMMRELQRKDAVLNLDVSIEQVILKLRIRDTVNDLRASRDCDPCRSINR